MLHTGFAVPLTDREIHSGILQHPLRIVRLSHGGRSREELRVEADGTVEVLHGDVDVQTFHAPFLRKAVAARGSRSGPQASPARLQQFSLRNPTSASIASVDFIVSII